MQKPPKEENGEMQVNWWQEGDAEGDIAKSGLTSAQRSGFILLNVMV